MVLVAIIGILLIALHQPDQTATTTDRSRRTPNPAGAGSQPVADPVGRPSPAPVTMSPAMPSGFNWMEAGPVPRFRSGFALVLILATVGALLAVAVAATVVAIARAIQGTL